MSSRETAREENMLSALGGIRNAVDQTAALRAQNAELVAALEGIRDAQWLWHGGKGYTRDEHAQHVEELKGIARAAIATARQPQGSGE